MKISAIQLVRKAKATRKHTLQEESSSHGFIEATITSGS